LFSLLATSDPNVAGRFGAGIGGAKRAEGGQRMHGMAKHGRDHDPFDLIKWLIK